MDDLAPVAWVDALVCAPCISNWCVYVGGGILQIVRVVYTRFLLRIKKVDNIVWSFNFENKKLKINKVAAIRKKKKKDIFLIFFSHFSMFLKIFCLIKTLKVIQAPINQITFYFLKNSQYQFNSCFLIPPPSLKKVILRKMHLYAPKQPADALR